MLFQFRVRRPSVRTIHGTAGTPRRIAASLRVHRGIRLGTLFGMLLHGPTSLAGNCFQGAGGDAEGVAIDQLSSEVTHSTQNPRTDEAEECGTTGVGRRQRHQAVPRSTATEASARLR